MDCITHCQAIPECKSANFGNGICDPLQEDWRTDLSNQNVVNSKTAIWKLP